MMTKRDVVKMVLGGEVPPYVPWHFGFTLEPQAMLKEHFGTDDLQARLSNHLLQVGPCSGFFEELEGERFRDHFGVVWDRSRDKDIGVIEGLVIPEADMAYCNLPDPLDARCFENITPRMQKYPDCFSIFSIGFSLYERAWSLRGMENLMMDMIEEPEFVHQLLDAIADYNISQLRHAGQNYNIDAVYFGDDWGQQTGLILGPALWHEFIYPRIQRMYTAVHELDCYVFIHSCGKVEELFDDLVAAGLNCFNPFQPEVMDVHALMRKYRGKLSFHGGLSTQKTLPFGSVDDVRAETRSLLETGKEGSYILAPAHAVEGDVPLENLLAFIEEAHSQPGWAKGSA